MSMTDRYYPIQTKQPPVFLVRELLANPNTTEDEWVDLLRSAYATGYTDAQAEIEPSHEWDSDAAAMLEDR